MDTLRRLDILRDLQNAAEKSVQSTSLILDNLDNKDVADTQEQALGDLGSQQNAAEQRSSARVLILQQQV